MSGNPFCARDRKVFICNRCLSNRFFGIDCRMLGNKGLNAFKPLILLLLFLIPIIVIAATQQPTTMTWVVGSNKSVTFTYGAACSTTLFYYVESDAYFDSDSDGNAWQIRPNSSSGGGVETKCQSSTFAPLSILNNGNTSVDINAVFTTALDANTWLKVWLGTGTGCGAAGPGGGDSNGMRGWSINCALFAPTDFTTALGTNTCRDFNSANSTMAVKLVSALLQNDSNQLCFSGELRGPQGDTQPALVGSGSHANDFNVGIPT